MTRPTSAQDQNQLQPGNFRILLAEDCPVNQKITLRLLEDAGYHADLTDNGQTTVAACQEKAYDLILMDLEMPTMDGLQAARLIRDMEKQSTSWINSRRKRTPIIALTGYSSLPEGLGSIFDDCISKPLRREDLLLTVRKWIEQLPNPPPETPRRSVDEEPNSSEFDAPLDLEKVLEEFLGNQAVLKDVLHTFADQIIQQIQIMRQALAEGNFEVVRAQAHALKGGAANLTAYRLADLAARIELSAVPASSGHLASLLEDLQREIGRIEIYLARPFFEDENPDS